MSTQFTNRQWRLPNNENKDKQSNYSMDFDGSSYITCNQISKLNSATAFSISVWCKLDNVSGIWGDYVSNIGIKLDWNDHTGGFLQFTTKTTGSNNYLAYNVARDSNWHHIVCTYDAGVRYIYLDGVSVANDSVAPTQMISTLGDNFLIGKHQQPTSMAGQIDAVSIFDYALSSIQITTLYGSSSTGIGNPMSLSPKPVAYYPLGDQDAFNGADYLVPNSSLKDYVFNFDGTSGQQIAINNNTLINGYTAVTFSFWFKGKSGLANFDGLLCQRSSSGKYNLIHVDGVTSTNYKVFIQQNGTSFARQNTNAILELDKWHHICIKGTVGNIWNIYIDGQLSNSYGSAQNISDIIQDTNPFRIGRDGNTYVAVGEFSNVQIFNTELPATGSNSVETLYNNGSPLTSMTGFTSLVSWWKLDASDTYDSSTGTWTIEDHAGSNDGTSSGMTQANLVQSDLSFTSGYSPYALDFDSASGDYIEVSNNTALQITGDITISAWVYAESDTGRVVSKRGGGGTNYDFFIQSRYLRLYDGVSGPLSTGRINLNEWSHILISVNSGTGTYYINNVVSGTGTFSISPASTSQPFYIGGSFTPALAYFNGKLSNISIWNTALTSAQVTEIYSEGVPQNLLNHSAASSLVSWWQLGSNSSFNTNWTVLDEKGTNNGTSANMGEDAIVDGVGSYANGLSSGMGGDEVIGDAPYSTANALSVNMDVEDRVTDVPS